MHTVTAAPHTVTPTTLSGQGPNEGMGGVCSDSMTLEIRLKIDSGWILKKKQED